MKIEENNTLLIYRGYIKFENPSKKLARSVGVFLTRKHGS